MIAAKRGKVRVRALKTLKDVLIGLGRSSGPPMALFTQGKQKRCWQSVSASVRPSCS